MARPIIAYTANDHDGAFVYRDDNRPPRWHLYKMMDFSVHVSIRYYNQRYIITKNITLIMKTYKSQHAVDIRKCDMHYCKTQKALCRNYNKSAYNVIKESPIYFLPNIYGPAKYCVH